MYSNGFRAGSLPTRDIPECGHLECGCSCEGGIVDTEGQRESWVMRLFPPPSLRVTSMRGFREREEKLSSSLVDSLSIWVAAKGSPRGNGFDDIMMMRPNEKLGERIQDTVFEKIVLFFGKRASSEIELDTELQVLEPLGHLKSRSSPPPRLVPSLAMSSWSVPIFSHPFASVDIAVVISSLVLTH